METLNKKEGMKMLSKIWTIFISQSEDLWAEPFSHRKLRYRCFFERTSGVAERLLVYFHLGDDEDQTYLSGNPIPIYFYGAFNQMTVYQVRSSGIIRSMTEEEQTNFVALMKKRFAGKKIGDDPPFDMKPFEVRDALRLLESGRFYCFEPGEYAYNIYERG